MCIRDRLWAGTKWQEHINNSLVDCISGVILQSSDPDMLCSQWELALGKERDSEATLNISLDQSNISFIKDSKSKEDGIYAFVIKTLDRNAVLEKAKSKGFLVNDEISLGGVKIILE